MSDASATLAASEALRVAGDFAGSARVLDDYLIALPERGDEGVSEVLLARAQIALASGAIQEGRLRLRDLEARGDVDPGRWCSLAGVLAALVGDPVQARTLMWRAVARARQSNRPDLEARVWTNLAMVHIDTLNIAEAAGAVDYAFALGPDPGQRPYSLAVRAEIAFVEGRLHDAEADFGEAIAISEAAAPPWVWAAGSARSTRGAVLAQLGRCEEAARDLDVARRQLSGVPNPWSRAALEVWAGFLELAQGRPDLARARVAAARVPLAEGLCLLDADLGGRAAARQLAQALGDADPPRRLVGRPSLRVAPDGDALAIDASEPQPVRSAAARRILLALARGAVDDPGRPIPGATLIQAGWPGESILKDAALNRLYVALHQLRRAGLSTVLVTRQDGYLIDAASVQMEP